MDPLAETSEPTLTSPAWHNRYPALIYPNFRLWFVGQVIAAFGMWMQSTAQGYLVYELTQSPAYLGYVSFANGVPTWLFTLYGGVIADRVPRRTLMLITQTSMMILAAVLATLTLLHLIQPWHILVLAFLLGVCTAFDNPARQAFTLEIVDRQDLANAVVLNSMMFNLATTVGPAMAGFTYALVGPGWCFALNALSFTGVLSILVLIKVKPVALTPRGRSVLNDMKEGLKFAAGEPSVRALLFTVGMISLFGMPFTTLFPAWAVRVLGGDATTNGLLQSARGAGSLISAIVIASLGRFNYKGKILTAGTLTLPIMILLFSQVRWLPLSLLTLVGCGLAFIPIVNIASALVQTYTPDHLRGRVMGIYTLIFFGMWPLGGLWAGAVAQRFGEQAAVALGGSIVLVLAVAVYVFIPRLRALE